MVLIREEQERIVLDLLNKRTPIRVISNQAGMSFRDIGAIKKKAEKEKEAGEQQSQQEFLSSQAYRLFSEDKSPVQIAIELNIKAQQAIIFQREYWDLKGIHELNQIYDEIKGDPWSFVEIRKQMKNAGMGPEHVNRLLRIANNDLPALERRYERLQHEVNLLEFRNSNLMRNSDYYHASCEKEMMQMNRLSNERMSLETIVTNFKNTNEEYLKIKKTVEGKVMHILTGSKTLLRYAVFSLVESMRKDPDKYSSLIYPDMYQSVTPLTGYIGEYQPEFFTLGPNQQNPSTDYYTEDCIGMVVEEAEKVYKKLAKEWIDVTIAEYTPSTTSSLPSLPSPSDEK